MISAPWFLDRARRCGILAPSASLANIGKNGKGILSRWYPDTACSRLEAIAARSEQLEFLEGDGLELAEIIADRDDTRFFIDPTCTAGDGKKAGKLLYVHNEIDHARLFEAMAGRRANFLMTYDLSAEIV